MVVTRRSAAAAAAENVEKPQMEPVDPAVALLGDSDPMMPQLEPSESTEKTETKSLVPPPMDETIEDWELVKKDEIPPLEEETNDDEMIDVEGVEEEAERKEGEETPKKKARGRVKKEKSDSESKKARKNSTKESNEFMQAFTPAHRGNSKKKHKPEPGKPLIVDGMPVNPLSEPAVANAYGYDPAKDIVALGKGQLKSAYRRSRTNLETPQIDVKKYKLEVKVDHLLDEEKEEETEMHTVPPSEDSPGPSSMSPGHHTNLVNKGMPSRPPISPGANLPFTVSPLSGRRVSGNGWSNGPLSASHLFTSPNTFNIPSNNTFNMRRRSESIEMTDKTPDTPPIRQTRLSMAEQFPMAPPKVIAAPLKLATPPDTVTTPTNSNDSMNVPSPSSNKKSTSSSSQVTLETFCSTLTQVTAELIECNAILAAGNMNGI